MVLFTRALVRPIISEGTRGGTVQKPVLISKVPSVAIDGFEDLLNKPARTEGGPDIESVEIEDASRAEQIRTKDGIEPIFVSVDEAATALGISVRAVLKRLAKGQLNGRKVPGKTKERWVVDSASLPQIIHVQVATEKMRTKGGPTNEHSEIEGGNGAEPTGTEGGTNPYSENQTNKVVDAYAQLIAVVERQTAIIEHLTNDLRIKDAQIKLLTDSQPRKHGWWLRVCSWFNTPKD